MSVPHILILEDEPSIAESLVFVLESESFTTHWETLASRALAYLQASPQRQPVDLVVMDVGLPDMTGFEACKQLRRFSEVPVIFLTARGSELDRVVGLEIGADDYVVKPFSPRELAARVKAILKRTRQVGATLASAAADVQDASEFVIDTERKTIHYHQQLLGLTRLEFSLLQAMVMQPGRVFSREQLLDALGISTDAGYDRSIDGHIKTLRAKLRALKPGAEPIKTLRGFGYAYQPDNLQ
ncbi:two-component system response regulator CreB [Cellvibrio japonicus]|uniref:Two-component response regulator CreB n=1 Tax=Cellvibrio japonicus (strain Ueda107) TaxID=498211 RepID=B3PD41_CELJU|nr:two-component system response regulator CreB [Cellvibrio japonicus]ACE85860.1 two-component response regulator CreB [Cellvibrio japonicus Ueda107]QEI11973.1 two-component system response regulator CreB [Cellvibrio japonicus]QEI15547.1 two-component system response regulator CreB [Cellvibrio japonicus]QEI19126.1 two-component system response regulator CreB [Cellvibrio japonicus]